MRYFTALSLLILLLVFPLNTLAKSPIPATREGKLQERVEQKREEVKEKLQEKKEKLQERLQAFKDKNKAKIAEKVSNNLNQVNQKLAANWLKHLNKMLQLLTRSEERVDKIKQDGTDTTSAQQAITDAKNAIAAAKDSVQTQAGKDYTLIISSESKVGTEVSSARQNLHSDLKTTRDKVKTAKDALIAAVKASKGVVGGTDEK